LAAVEPIVQHERSGAAWLNQPCKRRLRLGMASD
jgi:hypothetical protein